MKGYQTLLVLTGWLLIDGQALAGSRLAGTGGVMQIEGASGGGLSPWGMLTGTVSEGEVAVTLGATRADVDDYHLVVSGVAANLYDRIELSYAHQRLALDTLGGNQVQEIYGAKLRLFGDVLYRPWGVWSLGVQHKALIEGQALARAVGARDTQGNDIYLAGSKLFFDAFAGRNLLVNTTLRSTKANQGGLLGFGGDRGNHRELMIETSVGLFLTPDWIVGAEYRQKPDNLGFAGEDDWRDVYVAWLISKHLSLTGALLDLGDIAGLERQRGGYLSLQLSL
ncbi:DUF3034 family protein [Kushneria marisflavi]|uniref:Uncharacterized protein n=1 Tax=Kushneria marisflavi TaxID=157779 RepID=A0A240UM00_9GAMM|nr:DUF3034 family protein [Kushneria marisflavi]ART62049.1 hypothetical protein B9H00_02315 [Kushneria marisflavi]RKD87114.1 hypothetical protein C8D96_0572 [Kushneria marisflavi]